jgi:ATP-binding cassette, subfamily C (CFTR/MRP), member 1
MFLPAYVPQLLSPVITFAIFTAVARHTGATLDPSRLFTALSLLLLQNEPLFNLFGGLFDLLSALGCLKRVQGFLSQEPRQDKRRILGGGSQEKNEYSQLNTLEKLPIVSVQDGSFGWTENERVTLSNINFTVNRGSVVAILGPVGSGKSTLLKGLLGETPVFEGCVTLPSAEVAFCGQPSWLIVSVVANSV